MADRCIEIKKKGMNITARVVDDKGNQLQPTEEERGRIVDDVMALMLYVKKMEARKLFNDYSYVERMSLYD